MEADVQRFHAAVRQWIEIDRSMRHLLDALKQRRAAKNILTQQITTYMMLHQVTTLDTHYGKIKIKIHPRASEKVHLDALGDGE
jgi:hypothetical protein